MEAGAGIICFVWVLTAISTGIVIARSAMKTLRFHGLAWEDYLMIISMALAIVYGTCTALIYSLDFGNHASQQQQQQTLAAFHSPKFAEYLYLSHAVGFMAPLFSRVSFCLYMLRVLGTASMSRTRSIHAFILFQLVVNIPITILILAQCGDFNTLWRHGLLGKAPSCVDDEIIQALAMVAVAFNAVTDLYLTILPAFVVWSIKVMTARARLGLVATLGLSFFATIASVIKIYYVYALYAFDPATRIVAGLIMVMGVEINVVVIAASIPVLAPLFLQKSASGGERQRRGIYKDPVLPTYDTGAQSEDVSLQSGKTFVASQKSLKNVEVVAKDLGSGTTSVFAEDSYLATTTATPTTPWDQLPEIVFMSENGPAPSGGQ